METLIRTFVTRVYICQCIADGRPRAVVWRRFQLHHVTHQLVHVHIHNSTSVELGAAFEICTHANETEIDGLIGRQIKLIHSQF